MNNDKDLDPLPLEIETMEQPVKTLSVLIFRLGKVWLALATIYCKEITNRPSIHLIPHRTGKVLIGIVNLNGKLELHVALHELLEIETSIEFNAGRLLYQRNRMVAILKEGELWTFPVDEVDGVYEWDFFNIENASVDPSQSLIDYIKGTVQMENKRVGLLDEELLFASLKRSIR